MSISVAEDLREAPVIIKKYANRRLYNTESSSYVTLDHLAAMVKAGTGFEVHDARTGEDITRSVLTQIIFEEEAKGQNLLPINFLRQLIRFYGDPMQAFVPGYLDLAMESFVKNEDEMRRRIAQVFAAPGISSPGFTGQTLSGGPQPSSQGSNKEAMQTLAQQNMMMFERAIRMFTPRVVEDPVPALPAAQSAPQPSPTDLSELKSEIEEMRRQLAELSQRK